MHDESKIYQKKIDLALQPISDYRTKSVLPSPYSANSVEFISENSQFPQNLQTLGPQKNNSWIPGNTYQKRLPVSFFCCLSQRHHGRTFHISWCSISAFFSKSFRTANLWESAKSGLASHPEIARVMLSKSIPKRAHFHGISCANQLIFKPFFLAYEKSTAFPMIPSGRSQLLYGDSWKMLR